MAVPVGKPNVQNLLIGAGVILLIIAGFFYFRSQNTSQESSLSPEEIIVQEEGAVKKTGEMVESLTEEELEALKQETESVLSSAGESTTLNSTGKISASGQAKRAYSDGKFYFQINASGLILPEKGYYYEGWLKKDEEFLSVGRLEVSANGEASLFYTVSNDKSDYNKVNVSLEPENSDPSPAEVVLEGEF